MVISPRVTLVFAALVAAGCSAPVVDDTADASGALTEGIVQVERSVGSDGATQSNVSAKFMRLGASADLDLAERIVGTRLELPSVGECMSLPSVDVAEKTASFASLGPIDLVDVGDVTVRVRAAAQESAPSMPLAARAFPDVGDLVSGVFYTSRDAESDLPAGAVYALESTGSSQVDRFSIEAEAPASPDDVRVGDTPLRDGVTLVEGVPALVQWSAGRARGDLVVIDMRGAGRSAMRCAFNDEGRAVLPAQAQSGAGSITFHRIRRRAFEVGRAPGVDVGEVRFDLSVVGRATVAPRAP